MKKIFLFICLLFSSYAFSQSSDSLLKKYERQLIYRYGSSFMKGETKLSFKDLQPELSNSSVSYDSYKKSKKDMTISALFQL